MSARMDTRMNMRRDGSGGFTLIELIVVVAIIGVLLAVAAPSFVSFISNYRATAAINDFLQGVTMTRAEALKQGRSMTMAPITAGDWRSGWTIFHDSAVLAVPPAACIAPDGVMSASDQTASMVYRHDPLPSSISIGNAGPTSYPFTDANSKTYVSFDGTGYPRQYCLGALQGGITMTNTQGKASNTASRTLCLSLMGRARVVQGVYSCSTSGY